VNIKLPLSPPIYGVLVGGRKQVYLYAQTVHFVGSDKFEAVAQLEKGTGAGQESGTSTFPRRQNSPTLGCRLVQQ
jgi:hypothetical protein